MKNVSIKKAVVLGIAVILVSIAFIPVVNAQFGTIFSKFSKNPNDDKVVKPANPVNSPPLRNCNLIIRLPANPVTMVVDYPALNSYFDTTLSNVPSGYDVSNGDYLGWCIDLDHDIADNTSYQVSLYLSYNTSMPSYLWHNNLSKVNYILNNKQGSWQQVQNAMWYLLDFGDEGLNSYGWAMVNDAIANGSSFCPGVGDVIAIIADAGIDVQYTVIEVQVPVYTLTVNTDGSGTVNPSAGTYASGNVVNVNATPDIGWTFDNWSGDVPSGHETDNPVTITMDANKTLNAHFSLCTYTITATAGSGGSISPSGSVIVNHGDDQTFTITPDVGYHISDVLVDSVSVGAVSSYTFYNVVDDHTIDAQFAIENYLLNVTVNGNGVVTKDPDQATYTYGTSVELEAFADPGWTFDHWSGDLTGDTNPDTIIMDDSKEVTAHFINDEDTEPPSVRITQPINALYIFNRPIVPFSIPIIIKGVTIEVDADDNESGIERVEFYIDGELQNNDTTAP